MSRTKKLFSLMLAVLLAVVILVMPTAQVIAKAQTANGNNTGSTGEGKYISEVRVGLGKSVEEAAASLAGYTILKNDKGDYADLNEGAGSDSLFGSKGEKVVLLGYRTTNDINDAVTDLAVMNMDGGYSVQEYEQLMERYLESQIKPLIGSFSAAIKEYRENYDSANPANKKRAQYSHDMLNNFIDDDTGSRLGDLFLSETKWELGDEAYEKLPDSEKKKHADLETILCQANGQATLTIQNLLARAADTSDTTWIERFIGTDPATIAEKYFPDTVTSDAEKLLAAIFEDDTNLLLSMWNGLQTDLKQYDKAVDYLDSFDTAEYDELVNTLKESTGEDIPAEQGAKAAAAFIKLQAIEKELAYYAGVAAVHDFLDTTEYFEEFTLLDFFSQSREQAKADMMSLYAVIASLSPGQRAGLQFMSLRELILMAASDGGSLSADGYASIEPVSIYQGVDRMIYEKGGVALTSEAMRKRASYRYDSEEGAISGLTKICVSMTVTFTVLAVREFYLAGKFAGLAHEAEDVLAQMEQEVSKNVAFQFRSEKLTLGIKHYMSDYELTKVFSPEEVRTIREARELVETADDMTYSSAFSRKLAIGCTVISVVLAGVSVWLTYRDLCDYYDTEFSPIPAYMVDEADITAVNAKGETIVIKNQTAYYKAALCNRTEKDEKYSEIGDKADLNGDVGRMWVALYSVKNPALAPILADSFKVIYGSENAPLEYTKGIHKFGSQAAFDLNNTYYAWNHGRDGIYVYYKTDDAAPRGTGAIGSITSAGALAACGGAGLLVGLLAGLLIMRGGGRKKETETAEN